MNCVVTAYVNLKTQTNRFLPGHGGKLGKENFQPKGDLPYSDPSLLTSAPKS